MSQQLEAQRTPATAHDVYAALAAAWPGSIGGDPSPTALVMMTAQSALETAYWKSMWNWNVGNIAGTGGDYVMLHAYTGAYRPYRAFASLQDGASAYLSLIAARYSATIPPAENGDISGFAAALKAKGYFEEDVSAYASALQSRYSTVAAALKSYVPNIPLNVATPKGWVQKIGEGVAAVAAGLLGVYALVAFTNPKRAKHARENPTVVPAYSQLRDLRYFAHPGGQGFGNKTVSFRTAHVLYNRGWIQPGWATRADQLLTPMAIITLDGLTALNATLDRPLAVNETSITHHPYAWYAWPVWQDNLVEKARRL